MHFIILTTISLFVFLMNAHHFRVYAISFMVHGIEIDDVSVHHMLVFVCLMFE